ncbi:hypothetical protein G4B88_025144 [Cannabis sativa]|uniref:Transmembrane protein n=1 Tax=Cannabis sativa TaxID=3483 RepID=A0A7J6DLX6_CANSA|nr:hypothetical protein G4B88_025144 [Cannabis sativa]
MMFSGSRSANSNSVFKWKWRDQVTVQKLATGAQLCSVPKVGLLPCVVVFTLLDFALHDLLLFQDVACKLASVPPLALVSVLILFLALVLTSVLVLILVLALALVLAYERESTEDETS